MNIFHQYLSVKPIRKFLKQPYPYYFTKDNLWVFFAIIFLIPFLFSYFFEPFEVARDEHKMSYFWICFLHSLSPTIISFVYFFVLNYFIKSYEEWTVGKEFLHIAIVLLLIGIGSFLLRDIIYNNPHNWSWRYFIEEVRNTFLVGMLLIAIIIPANFNHLLRSNTRKAQTLKNFLPKQHNESVQVLIQAQVKSDNFELNIEDLLVIRTDGNYSEFYIQTGEAYQKLLKRISLKEIEQQLSDYPELIKTHRAWLVNIRKVTKTTGNAQGYQLEIQNFPEKVPVSRSMIPQFNERMSLMNT